MLLALALCANRSPQFSVPAPVITALSGALAGSATCSSGGGGFGGSVQVGSMSITVMYTITNTSATGYVAQLSLNGSFIRNVALSSTSTSLPITGAPGAHTAPFTQNGALVLSIVRSDGVTVSTKSSISSGCPAAFGTCP